MANEYYSNASAGERFLAGEVASGSAVDAKYDSIEAGFDKLPTPVQLSQGTANYAADTGAANAYVIALPKVPTSYTAGMQVRFLAANASTGASTINVNALGVKSLRRQDGTPIVAGDIPSGMPVTATYNGTNFRLDTSTAVMVDEAEAARDASQAAQASAETAYGQAYAARTDAILAKADALGSASDSANSATAALASQNAAASSETAAAGSASAAAGSASTASTQATNAATSASDSQVSATASAASAAAAAGSEAGVAADAAAALAHKNAAATSETNAAASETAAAASETAAAASQTAASGSASAAANSASNASTSAGTATTQAGTATTQAGIATTQASNAAGSASAAATSAANAATSETNAATSAATATGAQAAAEAARDSALTAFDNFDDRYLGTKAADPALDNDGNALVAGALYFDSVAETMKVYTGSAWVAAYVSGTDVALLSGAAFTGNVTAPNLNIAAWDAVAAAFPTGTDTQTVRFNGTILEATSALVIDGTGNVGIGDTSPSVPLSVDGALRAGRSTAQYVELLGDASSTNISAVATSAKPLLITNDTTLGGAGIQYRAKTGASHIFYHSTDGGSLVNRMIIDSVGNVGIGTASPDTGHKLDVNGSIKAQTAYAVNTYFDGSWRNPVANNAGSYFQTSTNQIIHYVMDAQATADAVTSARPAWQYLTDSQAQLWFTNSVERMRIDSSGNVGIGTDNPSYPLQIADSGVSLALENQNNTVWRVGQFAVLDEFTIRDETVGANRLHIDSVGNVGIGTTTPDSNLDISSAGTPEVIIQTTAASGADAILTIRGSRTTSTAGTDAQIQFKTNDSSSAGDQLASITAGKDVASTNRGVIIFSTSRTDGGTPTEAMRIGSDGNIAVTGTVDGRDIAVDGAKLDTFALGFLPSLGNYSYDLNLAPHLPYGRALFSSFCKAAEGAPHTYSYVLQAGGYSNGGGGFQLAFPYAESYGKIKVRVFDYASLTWKGWQDLHTSVGANVNNGDFTVTNELYANSWIRSSGNQGWYSQTYGGGIHMQDTTYVRVYGSKQFYVANSITATGNVTAYSDARLKANIETLPNALDKVMAMRGVEYDRIDRDYQHEVGVIAQEVLEVLPDVVTYNKEDDRYGVDYGRITAVLIEAIKEQQNQIDALKEQVRDLTN